MMESIITGAISLIGIVITATITKNQMQHELDKRITILEEKVDAHNRWGEKFQAQGVDIALIKQDIGYIKENIPRQ